MPIAAPAAVPADARERLQALGYVGVQSAVSTTPASELSDPKDKREILEQYRAAVDLAGERKWVQGIGVLQQILAADPGMADVWNQLATFAIRAGRFDQAIDAYKHEIELTPAAAEGYIGAAETFLHLRKLDEAREHADLAAQVADRAKDVRQRAAAHELLARIALQARDADAARQEAALAHEADPTVPMGPYVDGRLLYDQGKFEEALPLFARAEADLKKNGGLQLPDLHYYAGDSLGRLERYPEAEREFLEELRFFPQNTRARAGLAMLYAATDRADAAARVIGDMMRVTPTPESYALAARLWTMFGNKKQADAVRAEARRTFAEPSRALARGTRR